MSETMRKMSTLKFPKVPERYEIVDAQARKSIEGLEKTTSTHGKDIDTLKKTVSTQGTSISTLTGTSAELQNDVSGLQDHFSSEMKEVSGDIVQIESMAGNVLRPVTVLEPKQAGSGDPYPAGGGKNLVDCTVPVSGSGLTFNAEENGFSVSGTPTTAYNKRMFLGAGLKAGVYTLSVRYDGSVSSGGGINVYINADIQRSIWKSGTLSGTYSNTFELTADIESFAIQVSCTAGITYNVRVTEIQLEAGSAVTPYAPYSNIRPITGYDKLDLGVRGKNIFPAWAESSYTMNGVTFTKQADGSIRAQGTPTAYAYITLTDYKTLKEHGFTEGVHTISGLPEASNAWFVDLIGDANTQNINFYQNGSFNLSAEVKGNGTYAWRIVITPNMGAVDLIFKPQVEFGSAATPFAPYAGNTYTVQIGQTIYGGRMDWLTGKLVAEWEMEEFDGINRKIDTVGYLGDGTCYCVYRASMKPFTVEKYGSVCSHLVQGSSDYGQFYISGGVGDQFFMYFEHFESLEAANQYLTAQKAAGTPVQIAYKLATPIEIQLTPTQILALQGTNTLYGDGTISLSTKGDILGVVDRVATVEQTLFDTKEYKYNGSVVQFDAPLEGSPIEAVTVIEPRQAGSGDPYPMGGGKNLCELTIDSQTKNGVSITVDKAKSSITLNGTASADVFIYNGFTKALPVNAYTMTLNNTKTATIPNGGSARIIAAENADSHLTNCNLTVVNSTTPISNVGKTIGGIIIWCVAGTVFDNVVLDIQIELGETASPFESYANIRPITGWDAVGLNHVGKNLFLRENILDGLYVAMTQITALGGTKSAFIKCKPNTTYTVSKILGFTFRVAYTTEYPAAGVPVKNFTDDGAATHITFRTGSDAQYLVTYVWLDGKGDDAEAIFASLQIEEGNVATAYEAPGNIYTVQIGQTVYGGKFDWLTGKLNKNVGNITLDGSQEAITSWHGVHGNIIVAYSVPDALIISTTSKSNLLISDKLKTEIADDQHQFEPNTNSISMSGSSGCIAVCIRGITTLSDMHTWLSQNPVECVYPLATPIEIQLTPQDLTTLRGMNTISSDAGETSITVRKDIFSLLSHLTKQNKELKDTIRELQS